MCGHYREKIHVNHFWELKGLAKSKSDGTLILDQINWLFLIEQNLINICEKKTVQNCAKVKHANSEHYFYCL